MGTPDVFPEINLLRISEGSTNGIAVKISVGISEGIYGEPKKYFCCLRAEQTTFKQGSACETDIQLFLLLGKSRKDYRR